MYTLRWPPQKRSWLAARAYSSESVSLEIRGKSQGGGANDYSVHRPSCLARNSTNREKFAWKT